MKNCNKISLATIALLNSTYMPALMAEEETSLKTITVVGQQSALQQRQQAPNSIVVLDQVEIDRFNDRTAGDVIRRLPSVLFGGSPGENKDVRIRGLDKKYSQVLINGRRIPGGGEKREFQLDQLPVDLIERIELIRSPTADMDSQGLAGTINIILKSIPNEPSLHVTLGAGHLETGDTLPNLTLSYGEQKENFGYFLNLNVQQRQVLKDKTKNIFKGDGSLDKIEKEIEDNQLNEVQLAPRFNWNLSEHDTLIFEPLLLSSDADKSKQKLKLKANGSGNGKELAEENSHRLAWAVNTEWQHAYTSGSNFTLGLNLQESRVDKDVSKYAYKADSSLDKITTEVEDKSDKEWQLSLKGKRLVNDQHTLKAGIDFTTKDRIKNKVKVETKNGSSADKTAGKDLYEINEKRFNAYVLDEFTLNDRHMFTPGIRFEWADTGVSSSGLSQSNNDSIWNPSLHYRFKWSDTTNVRASIARTVRRPKFDELSPYITEEGGSQSDPDSAGNPNLVPEISTGIDVGIEHYFAQHAGNIGLNIFYRDIEDKIETRTHINADSGRYEDQPDNVGAATLKGIELDSSYNMASLGLKGLTLKGNVTFLDGEVTDKDTGVKTPFKEQIDYVYNLGFDHKISNAGISWGMNLSRTSEQETDKTEDGEHSIEIIEPQDLLDLYLRKSLSQNFELRFSAQNLLKADKDKLKTVYNTDGSVNKSEHELESSNRIYYLSISGTW